MYQSWRQVVGSEARGDHPTMKLFSRRKSGFVHETLKDHQSSFKYKPERVPSTLPTSDDSSSFDSEEHPRIQQIRLQQDGELKEMRKVLDEVGVFRKCRASKKQTEFARGIDHQASNSSLSKSGWKAASKEPVWKRRLRNVRSPMGGGRKKDDDVLKNTIVSVRKSVSWDDEFPRDNAKDNAFAGETTKSQQRKSRKGEKKVVDRGPSLRREGSSFSDFFRFVADQDMFSLQTPSYFSEATSAVSGTPTVSESSESVTDAYTDEIDDDSTISSYPRYRRRRSRRRSRAEESRDGQRKPRKMNMFGCQQSDASLAEDFRLFAELVLKDASCSTCFSEPTETEEKR